MPSVNRLVFLDQKVQYSNTTFINLDLNNYAHKNLEMAIDSITSNASVILDRAYQPSAIPQAFVVNNVL